MFGGAPAVASLPTTLWFVITDNVVVGGSIVAVIVGYDLPHEVHEVFVATLNLAKYDVADLDVEARYGIYEACVAGNDERLEGAVAARVLDRVAVDERPVLDCVPFVGQIAPQIIVGHHCPIV